ncbi:MAG: MoaD/ThiS family protein [Coriobacteriia bacterium]|nr:MoaD/ThiS family protein [Coriobacteriia bacterium]
MRIQLALFASLSQYLPEADAENRMSPHARAMDLPDGITVGQVITLMGLPDEPRIVFVNGRHEPDEQVLAEGDRMAVFPPVAGG